MRSSRPSSSPGTGAAPMPGAGLRLLEASSATDWGGDTPRSSRASVCHSALLGGGSRETQGSPLAPGPREPAEAPAPQLAEPFPSQGTTEIRSPGPLVAGAERTSRGLPPPSHWPRGPAGDVERAVSPETHALSVTTWRLFKGGKGPGTTRASLNSAKRILRVSADSKQPSFEHCQHRAQPMQCSQKLGVSLTPPAANLAAGRNRK